jgi:uncharacterized integral membrane protein
MGFMQKLKGLWDRMRLVLVAVLTALVLLFALQNLHAVRIDVVFWQVEYSASLLVLVAFLAGLAVGGVTTFYYKGRFFKEKKARRKAVAAAAEAEQIVKALPASPRSSRAIRGRREAGASESRGRGPSVRCPRSGR